MSFILGLLALIIIVGFIWNFVFVLGFALFVGCIVDLGVANALWYHWVGAITTAAGLLVALWIDINL